MTKLVLCCLLLSFSLLSSVEKRYLPHEYEYLPLNQGDQIQKIVRIKTLENVFLEFKLTKRECDAYVDNCFLSFSNEKNPEYYLSGSEVCFGSDCKGEHPSFPNFSLVLKRVTQNEN